MLEQSRRNAVTTILLALVFALVWSLTKDLAVACVSMLLTTSVIGVACIARKEFRVLSLMFISMHFFMLAIIIFSQNGIDEEALIVFLISLATAMASAREVRLLEKRCGEDLTPPWQLTLASLPIVGPLIYVIWHRQEITDSFGRLREHMARYTGF